MIKSFKRIQALARIILLDGLRRHALVGLLVLSIAAEAGGLLFFDFIPRDIGRASVDFIFSVSWIAGFIFLFFHGVQVIAWDEERRVIHTILARPLSRGEYVVGVFLGLGTLLLLLNLLLGLIGWGILTLIKHSVAIQYFSHFSIAHYLISWCGLFVMELMVLAIIMLFSGLIRGSFPVLLVSLCFYLICSGLPVVQETVLQHSDNANNVVANLLKGVTAVFPDFGRLDFKDAIVTKQYRINWLQAAGSFGLSLTYIILSLWMACVVYSKRDLQ